MSANLKLTAEQLPALSDGLVGKMVDAALKTAACDLDDRGDDGKPRKVTLEISMSKEPMTNKATITADVKVSVPKYMAPKTHATISGENGVSNIKFDTTAAVPIDINA